MLTVNKNSQNSLPWFKIHYMVKRKKYVFFTTEVCPKAVFYHVVAVKCFYVKRLKVQSVCKSLYWFFLYRVTDSQWDFFVEFEDLIYTPTCTGTHWCWDVGCRTRGCGVLARGQGCNVAWAGDQTQDVHVLWQRKDRGVHSCVALQRFTYGLKQIIILPLTM